MDSVKLVGFWVAIALFMTLEILDMMTGITMWILVAVFFAYYRQELRKKLNMKNDSEDAIKDFAMWCCCACCAITQEARQVKDAPKEEPTKEGALEAPQPVVA